VVVDNITFFCHRVAGATVISYVEAV